ncbi:hypothetical protein, partial [Capnocytophaga sp. oral taxon 332]|uniref:hypothetical protein n=1 Tax=Capnocytophaga sp. oral taxon 332 TaxID=712213 RepID=UPI001E45B6A3
MRQPRGLPSKGGRCRSRTSFKRGGDAEVVLLKTFWIASVVGVSRYELQARTSGGRVGTSYKLAPAGDWQQARISGVNIPPSPLQKGG